MRKTLIALAVCAVSFAASAQSGSTKPMPGTPGTWKLNLAKSTFTPGPAPKSGTVTVADDGKRTMEFVGSDGQTMKSSVAPELGKAVPVDGAENATITLNSQTNDKFTETRKGPDGTFIGKGVLSKDGKTLRYVDTGTDAKGNHVHNVEVWEKQ